VVVVSCDSAWAKPLPPLAAWAPRRAAVDDKDEDCSILMSPHLRR
jgi:hypothetical protein